MFETEMLRAEKYEDAHRCKALKRRRCVVCSWLMETKRRPVIGDVSNEELAVAQFSSFLCPNHRAMREAYWASVEEYWG